MADLKDPALYVNREIGLLAFQRRVLEEAEDPDNPLLERVKFLSILGSNLDEFFMVRAAGLAAQLDAGTVEVGPDRMTPRAQLVSIRREVKRLLNEAHECLQTLVPALNQHGIFIHAYEELSPAQQRRVGEYFSETVFPVLTPLAFDPGRPFPHISNLSLNLAVLIRDPEGHEHFARVKVPDSLPQLAPLSGFGPAGSKRTGSRRVERISPSRNSTASEHDACALIGDRRHNGCEPVGAADGNSAKCVSGVGTDAPRQRAIGRRDFFIRVERRDSPRAEIDGGSSRAGSV
jgi:polyphosphate kinase